MSIRNLTKTERQAYEGATMFYYYFLPLSILTIIAYDLFLLLAVRTGYISQSQEAQWFTVGLCLLLTFLSYFPAHYFYQLCHSIDVSPVQPQNYESANDRPPRIYCSQCNLLCQYRTRHCQKCRMCIQRYDHHCFWIGGCVGRHNHRQFWLFLLFQTLNSVFILIALIDVLELTNYLQIDLNLFFKVVWWAQLSLTLGFIGFTSCLLLYHSWLVSNGATTWEHFSHSRISYLKHLPSYYRPFSLGFFQNWHLFLTEHTRASALRPVPVQQWGKMVVTRSAATNLPPQCSITQNKYYSCC